MSTSNEFWNNLMNDSIQKPQLPYSRMSEKLEDHMTWLPFPEKVSKRFKFSGKLRNLSWYDISLLNFIQLWQVKIGRLKSSYRRLPHHRRVEVVRQLEQSRPRTVTEQQGRCELRVELGQEILRSAGWRLCCKKHFRNINKYIIN